MMTMSDQSPVPIWVSGSSLARAAFFLGMALFVAASPLMGQDITDLANAPIPVSEGWSGFTDLGFLLHAFLDLALAAVLGAIVGYHPRRVRTADTIQEIEAPKVSVVYAVLGSLIGILVVRYGLGVGFVLFGIGALARFRTVMRSAQLTGQVIFVTLVGLTCGMDLPHVGVLAVAFDFILTYLLETRITFQVDVRGLPQDRFVEACNAYRSALTSQGYRIFSETKRPDRGRICLIFRSSGPDTRLHVEEVLNERIEEGLRGSLDWEVD